VPQAGHCARVSRRLSQASEGHDAAVPFFIAHFFISRQLFKTLDKNIGKKEWRK
jgi:hypothetical protein